MSNYVYSDLLNQYQNLSLEEKQAILIYKSPLFNFMNAVSSVDNFEILDSYSIASKINNLDKYIKDIKLFRDILYRPENLITRITIFNNIDFDNCYDLIDKLKNYYFIIRNASNKIVLNDDLVVYRGVSIDGNYNINDIARGNIISTSIKKKDTNLFLFKDDVNIFYTIKLKKGTHVLVCPISLVYIYKDIDSELRCVKPDSMKLLNRGEMGQEEVIIFKDKINIDNINCYDDDSYYIEVDMDTSPINRKGEEFTMNQEYYDKLASKLESVIKSKDLGETLTVEAFNYINILKDSNASDENKHRAGILGENLLSNVRDFPDVGNRKSR